MSGGGGRRGGTVKVERLKEIAKRRYSCRSFRTAEVPAATIAQLLSIAGRTPSWCNVQPWEVVLTSGAATERLSEALIKEARTGGDGFDIDAPNHYHGVHRERRRASGFALYESLSIARDDYPARERQGMENLRFFGAPHTAVVSADAELGSYALVDCGGYISTFLLAATSLGIASIAQAAVARYSARIHEHLGIPESRRIIATISFGFADEDHPANAFRTERATLAETVRFVN
jgi:nitroreductase